MRQTTIFLKSFLTVLTLIFVSNLVFSQCIAPVITSISNTSPVMAGGNVILSAKGTVAGVSSTSTRMAGIGGNAGNREFNVVFSSGDRPGTIDRISNATFDAIFAGQSTYAAKANVLKAKYDILMFTWASPHDANINWPLVTAFLNAGGSVFMDGDYANVGNLNDGTSASVVGISDAVTGGCNYTIVTPAPYPALVANGINGCFANDHLSVNSFPSWMAAYIKVGAKNLAVAGIYPYGNHGRLIVQGPDQDYHAMRGMGGTGGNQYQIILNQLDFLTSNQAGITWTGPNGFTSNDANPVLSSVTAAQGGEYTATLTNITGGGCFTIAHTTVVVNSPTPVPVITCPANIMVDNDKGKCGAIVSFDVSATGSATMKYSVASGSFFPSGTTSVTATATNSAGSSSCTFTVTVDDSEAPILTVPAEITVGCGSSLLPTNTGMATATDNCNPKVSITYKDDVTSLVSCGETIIRTWTASDGMNESTMTQKIIVSPATLPIMAAPAAITITIPCGGSPVPSTLSYTNGLADGCLISGTSNPSTFVTTPGTCGGTVTEFWTATDACGRTIASVSRILTVSQNLGTVGDFIMYSGNGAVSNAGSSTLTGNVGARIGAISGFAAPTTVNGSIYAAASSNAVQANIDLLNLYLHLSNIPVTNTLHAAAFGSGETITTGVYTVASAGSLAGNLILDGQGNPNSVFVIKFNGAFSPAAGSSVTLTNGIRASNVFFIAEGAISIGASSVMKGTFIGHTGAVTMAAGGDLEGRLLSTVGAVTFGPGTAILPSGFSTIPIICVNACDNAILGSTANFALFTSAGAVSNTGSSGIIGNIGSNAGAITNFETPATTLVGTSYNANSVTVQAKADLQTAYTQLAGIPATNSVHGVAFGSGETLAPGVYTVGAAGSLAGTLTLDGQGNPDAVFIFRFGGAFVTAAQSKVILINGARHCNIYWVAEGAVSMGTFSFMKGTLIANNGANTMGAYGNLEGRMFSTAGAIGFSTGVAYISYSLCGNPVPEPVLSSTATAAASAASVGLITTLREEKLTIYPNPNNGVLHLDYSGDVSKIRLIDVCDVLGKRVFSADHYQPMIVLANKVSGTYFVRVHLDTKVITYKIIVNK